MATWVWWAELGPPAGRRLALLSSRNAVYGARARVTVAPATRTIRNIPSQVTIGREDGMPSECADDLDDIQTIRKTRLIGRITTLPRAKMAAVDRAITFALDVKV